MESKGKGRRLLRGLWKRWTENVEKCGEGKREMAKKEGK